MELCCLCAGLLAVVVITITIVASSARDKKVSVAKLEMVQVEAPKPMPKTVMVMAERSVVKPAHTVATSAPEMSERDQELERRGYSATQFSPVALATKPAGQPSTKKENGQ
jgi:hypothetical protein